MSRKSGKSFLMLTHRSEKADTDAQENLNDTLRGGADTKSYEKDKDRLG